MSEHDHSGHGGCCHVSRRSFMKKTARAAVLGAALLFSSSSGILARPTGNGPAEKGSESKAVTEDAGELLQLLHRD